jgi:hypothetical protein
MVNHMDHVDHLERTYQSWWCPNSNLLLTYSLRTANDAGPAPFVAQSSAAHHLSLCNGTLKVRSRFGCKRCTTCAVVAFRLSCPALRAVWWTWST